MIFVQLGRELAKHWLDGDLLCPRFVVKLQNQRTLAGPARPRYHPVQTATRILHQQFSMGEEHGLEKRAEELFRVSSCP
jgi:hypothetical protein